MTSLEQCIRQQREEVAKAKASLPLVRAELRRVSSFVAPAGIMQHRVLHRRERCISQLTKKVHWLETDCHLKEFDARVIPYLNASLSARNTPNETAEACVPGTKKRKRSGPLVENFVSVQSGNAGTILREYLVEFDNATDVEPDVDRASSCPKCDVDYLIVDRKSQCTCPRCGFSVSFMDATTANLAFHTDLEFNAFSYKRLNHYSDWLTNVQGKEPTQVDDATMQQIMNELYKRRITRDAVTVELVRDVVKEMRLRKSYDHVTQICARLRGEPPPRFRPHIEEILKLMFISIQEPFNKFRGTRKNMLSYSYMLQKFTQLLGMTNIPMLHFSVLKGKDKLAKQDSIFEKVCEYLDWEFIPSI